MPTTCPAWLTSGAAAVALRHRGRMHDDGGIPLLHHIDRTVGIDHFRHGRGIAFQQGLELGIVAGDRAGGSPRRSLRSVRCTLKQKDSGVMAAGASSSSTATSWPPSSMRCRMRAASTLPVALLVTRACPASPTTCPLVTICRWEMKKPEPMESPRDCCASTSTVACSSRWGMVSALAAGRHFLPGRLGGGQGASAGRPRRSHAAPPDRWAA